MRITSRGLAAVTVGLVSAVVLAGCSSNSTKPTVLPSLQPTTVSSMPSPVATTPSPAATSPAVLPPVASTTQPSPESTTDLAQTTKEIEQATRAYFVTTNKSIQNASSLAVLRASFTATCQQCNTDLLNISKLHAAQKHVSGGEYKILDITSQAHDNKSGLSTITFSTAADIIYDKTGKIIEKDPAQPKQSAGLSLVKHGNHWLVVAWTDFGNVT